MPENKHLMFPLLMEKPVGIDVQESVQPDFPPLWLAPSSQPLGILGREQSIRGKAVHSPRCLSLSSRWFKLPWSLKCFLGEALTGDQSPYTADTVPHVLASRAGGVLSCSLHL